MELKIYTVEQLAEIIRKHGMWRNDEGGGERASLTRADLTGANLTGANLTRANLYRANLTGANLTGANLTRADLTHANLTGANLTRANLTGANLTGANLTGAKFQDCNLSGVCGILSVCIDRRGYNLVRWINSDGVKMYNAGCQCHTFDGAVAHWGAAHYADAERGALYVSAVRWLDSIPVEEM